MVIMKRYPPPWLLRSVPRARGRARPRTAPLPRARSRCASSSAQGRSRTGRARTTIRAFSRSGCRCSTSAARRPPARDTFPTKAQLDETDVAHPAQAGGGQHRAKRDRKNLNEYLARGGGLVGHPRRPRLARSRLVQDDRRRLVAQRHGEVARRADAALLHRSRQPDHQGRVQLGNGRRDLLRPRHAARGAHPGVGLHAEARRARATRTSSAAPTR